MRFSVWRVLCIALMPVLAMFAGLSTLNALDDGADWVVLAAIACAAATMIHLARRYATDGAPT
ncbi:MAG TPA: hypothetical protein VMU33_00090 [Burkholderiaceae bacterium]|nr:hypothetical protein [Burkholderiaceae bacterium]